MEIRHSIEENYSRKLAVPEGPHMPAQDVWRGDIFANDIYLSGRILGHGTPTDDKHLTTVAHVNDAITAHGSSHSSDPDPHTQYAMVTGRTGESITVDGTVTADDPTSSSHLATKSYVDNKTTTSTTTYHGSSLYIIAGDGTQLESTVQPQDIVVTRIGDQRILSLTDTFGFTTLDSEKTYSISASETSVVGFLPEDDKPLVYLGGFIEVDTESIGHLQAFAEISTSGTINITRCFGDVNKVTTRNNWPPSDTLTFQPFSVVYYVKTIDFNFE